jgi:hypothetical protein
VNMRLIRVYDYYLIIEDTCNFVVKFIHIYLIYKLKFFFICCTIIRHVCALYMHFKLLCF